MLRFVFVLFVGIVLFGCLQPSTEQLVFKGDICQVLTAQDLQQTCGGSFRYTGGSQEGGGLFGITRNINTTCLYHRSVNGSFGNIFVIDNTGFAPSQNDVKQFLEKLKQHEPVSEFKFGSFFETVNASLVLEYNVNGYAVLIINRTTESHGSFDSYNVTYIEAYISKESDSPTIKLSSYFIDPREEKCGLAELRQVVGLVIDRTG